MGWVISQANEWEGYSDYLGGKVGDFQELGHCPHVGLLMLPWNCYGASGCVI